jgi:hypothetical protein
MLRVWDAWIEVTGPAMVVPSPGPGGISANTQAN